MQRKRPNTDQPVDFDANKTKRPVSCAFCRSRKLRCTRVFPCSNCVARGITCQIHASQADSSSPIPTLTNGAEVSQAEILQRLQRLEELFQNQISNQGRCQVQHVGRLAGSDRTIPSPAATQSETQPQTPEHLLPLAADIARLENLSVGESFSVSRLDQASEL